MRIATTLHGIAKRARRRLQARGIILIYHSVNQPLNEERHSYVSPSHFSEQMECLRREVDILPLEDLLLRLRDARLTRRYAAITFDDGYANNLLMAGPILKKLEVPASVFVTTGYLDANREYWWDELYHLIVDSPRQDAEWLLPEKDLLSPDYPEHASRAEAWRWWHERLVHRDAATREEVLNEIAQRAGLARTVREEYRPLTPVEVSQMERELPIAIGAHTVNHLRLAAHPQDTQVRELRESKRRLEEILGHPVTSLAYPYGKRDSITLQTLEYTREAGYRLACANVRGQVFASTNPLWLPRVTPHDVDGDEFARRLRDFWEDWSGPRLPSQPLGENA